MGVEHPVTVRFYEPPEDLAQFFTSFYCAEIQPLVPGPVSDRLHPEWAGLRIFSGAKPISQITGQPTLWDADVVVTGPSSIPLHFSIEATRFWSVGFLPLGWATFVGQPANHFANTAHDARSTAAFAHFVPLADKLLSEGACGEGTDPTDPFPIMENFFRNEAPRFGNGEPRIRAIHAAMIEPELPNVSEMAERCGVHPRTLERLCLRHFGFTPKLLLRRQRFMRSLSRFMLDPSMGWAKAIDSLYVDQSHFVRDCHDFLGMPPSTYTALDHPILAAFMRERHRVLGSPVQTLDPPR